MTRFLAIVSVLAVAVACTSPPGSNVEDKRSFVRKMRDQTLAQLYEANPDLQAKVEGAAGYAVFTNLNIHLLAISGEDGYGIAVERSTGNEKFMKMASIGGGPGIAMRDFRTIFVFRDEAAIERFRSEGWQFSLEGGASAQTSDRGGSMGGVAAVSADGNQHATVQTEATKAAAAAAGQGIEVYQLTQAGLALHAAALGTRYFLDDELN
jgi:lipid-binding SYLF domain-containing protein